MKLKTIFCLYFFMVLFSSYSQAQYFEFGKLLRDTASAQNFGSLIMQLQNHQYLVAGYAGVAIKNNKVHRYLTLNKVTEKGDSIFSFASYKSSDAGDRTGYLPNPQNISFVNGNKYLVYDARISPGYVLVDQLSCDTNGNNMDTALLKFKVSALDSVAITHPEIHVKYLPGECFYIYGQSPYAPDSSFIIWKLDTSGKLIWRQDYYDTCNSTSFQLNITKNKLLLSSLGYNKRSVGLHLNWLDLNGNLLLDKIITTPLYLKDMDFIVESVTILPDSGVLIATDRTLHLSHPWPLLVRYDKNFDTLWSIHVKDLNVPSDPDNLPQIKKIAITGDSNIAVFWYDNTGTYLSSNSWLNIYNMNGKLQSRTGIDSVCGSKHIWAGGFNDMVATADNGFAFVGDYVINYTLNIQNPYLLKLSNTLITAVADENINKAGIYIYPNPAHEIMNIKTGSNLPSKLVLYNLQGSIIYQCSGTGFLQINKQDISNGMYLLKIINTNGSNTTRKVIFE